MSDTENNVGQLPMGVGFFALLVVGCAGAAILGLVACLERKAIATAILDAAHKVGNGISSVRNRFASSSDIHLDTVEASSDKEGSTTPTGSSSKTSLTGEEEFSEEFALDVPDLQSQELDLRSRDGTPESSTNSYPSLQSTQSTPEKPSNPLAGGVCGLRHRISRPPSAAPSANASTGEYPNLGLSIV